jgi:MFS family permease
MPQHDTNPQDLNHLELNWLDSHNSTAQDANNGESEDEPQEETQISRWLAIAAASAILFIGVGYTNTFGVFESYYQRTLFPNEAPDKLILIGSIAASLYFILGAVTGRFADLVGYGTSLFIGSGLMVGAMFSASVSTKLWQLFLSQGLCFGLGVAFVYPPATTISRQYFGRRHGVANGIVVSGGALGGCVLPFAVKVMIERHGLPSTFRILGYLALGVLAPSICVLRPKRSTSARPSSHSRSALLDLSLLRNSRFLVLLVACTIAMTGFLPRYFLIPTSAVAQGIDQGYASWLLGLMNGLSIVGRIGIGYVADRFGKLHALSASFILCGLGHFAFWLPGVTINTTTAETPTALFTLFVVYIGIFGSGFISLFPVVVAHMFGSEALASKTGLLNTAIGLSVLAGPSAVYAIIGDGQSTRWMVGVLTAGLFLFFGGAVLLSASMAMDAVERKRLARLGHGLRAAV